MAKQIGEETKVTLDLIRQTILDTQEDVEAMREQLDKIDERLYEMQKNR